MLTEHHTIMLACAVLLLLHVTQLSAERQKAEHAAEQSELQSHLSEVQREAAVARAMTEGWQRDSKVRAHAQRSNTAAPLEQLLSAVLWYATCVECSAGCVRWTRAHDVVSAA
jgi:hypothetical protein